MKLALMIVQMLCGLFLIVIIMLQSGKSSGLSGAVGGNGADTFFGKGKAKNFDAKLARATKWVGICFVALTLVLSLIK